MAAKPYTRPSSLNPSVFPFPVNNSLKINVKPNLCYPTAAAAPKSDLIQGAEPATETKTGQELIEQLKTSSPEIANLINTIKDIERRKIEDERSRKEPICTCKYICSKLPCFGVNLLMFLLTIGLTIFSSVGFVLLTNQSMNEYIIHNAEPFVFKLIGAQMNPIEDAGQQSASGGDIFVDIQVDSLYLKNKICNNIRYFSVIDTHCTEFYKCGEQLNAILSNKFKSLEIGSNISGYFDETEIRYDSCQIIYFDEKFVDWYDPVAIGIAFLFAMCALLLMISIWILIGGYLLDYNETCRKDFRDELTGKCTCNKPTALEELSISIRKSTLNSQTLAEETRMTSLYLADKTISTIDSRSYLMLISEFINLKSYVLKLFEFFKLKFPEFSTSEYQNYEKLLFSMSNSYYYNKFVEENRDKKELNRDNVFSVQPASTSEAKKSSSDNVILSKTMKNNDRDDSGNVVNPLNSFEAVATAGAAAAASTSLPVSSPLGNVATAPASISPHKISPPPSSAIYPSI